MCDCFHLAFPNWHAPAAGAGRRLRGPEQEAEDDSVCEEPEILERERPRPQGSSPVEEFPVEKQAEEDMSVYKSGSNKKSRKSGFGSLFDKHSSDKMNETEDMQSDESEIIVKTVKEPCIEGLVVTGGGKEGIFIKEVKLDSPASKHLSVKEGDQILSATVYFDNVSYEDALQILEHAQPYKMEFCLRRKVDTPIPENAEIIHPKEKDQGQPTMRGQTKIKKQQERISWPKFPSFGKGSRMQFRRSHSTSEAEEHRKLEMSPPTSDTESPLKSPLKSSDGKDKKKKHKVQLKIKMKGHRSKSVEEPQTDEQVMAWENQQVEDILEEKVPEELEEKKQDVPKVLDGAEYEVSSKTGNDDPLQNLSGMELYEAHLISLGSTLKTTDISVALSEGGQIESSEMKVRIQVKEQTDIDTENQAENIDALYTTSDPSPCENVVLSQAEVEISQLDNDPNRLGIDSEKKMQSEIAELSIPNLDICVGETKKSPGIGSDKQSKERSVFENESYGIRTRGPLADMATSKTHFVNTINGLQFISPDYPEIAQAGEISVGISDTKKPTVISQPKPGSTGFAVDKDNAILDIKTSKIPPGTADFILADQDKKSASKFNLPKVDEFVSHELIKMTEVGKNRTLLPKREDIEIPGMEHKETKFSLQTTDIKGPKIEKIINITKEREIQSPQTEFNVEDVKVAVSKFPAFKLPEGDITGVLVQREITIMEQKSDKSLLTPRGSPHKVSITSTDSSPFITKSKVDEERSPSDTAHMDTAIKMAKVELPYIDDQTPTTVMKIDYTKPQMTDYGRLGDINFKLPKREDIEIPGMEAIKESILQNTVIEAVRDADLGQVEKPKTKKHGDKKGHEKKSKKPKISTEGFDITKPDIQSPNISMELPKGSVKMDTGEIKIPEKHKFKTPKVEEFDNFSVSLQEAKILEDNMDKRNLPPKTETKFGKTKFKIPSITIPEFETKFPRGEDISAVDVQEKAPEKNLPREELSAEQVLFATDDPDVNKDGQTVRVSGRVQDTEPEEQGKKFKLPKFELSFPEVKAPKLICTSKKDDDSSVSEASGEVPVVHSPKTGPPDIEPEVRTDQPEVGYEITEVKFKKPGFSFPRFGISKSEYSAPVADVTITNVDIALPEGHRELDDPNANVAISVKDAKQKDATKFVSPTKFKIPSIKFPNFGTKVPKAAMESPDVNVDVKGTEISLPDAEIKLTAEPALVNIKSPDANKESTSLSMEKKDQDIHIKEAGSKFKLPKFGIGIPEIKGPKIDIISGQEESDISVPKANIPVNLTDFEVKAGTTDLKADLDKVYIPKTAREISEVNIDAKGPDISLPDAELKLPAETLSVDIKGPDADKGMKLLSIEMKDLQVEEQGSKFNLPKFGISVPEVKVPKIDASSGKAEIDISIPKGKVEIYPPDIEAQTVTADIKGDLPKLGSKDIEVKMKTPGFSFPPSGFSKSETKAPKVDVSLPEGSIKMERPAEDITVSMEDAEEKDPTKFKLPSFTLPKFGTKYPKFTVEVSNVDRDAKGPEINLPDTEIKLSAEPLTVDINDPDADKKNKSLTAEMDQDLQIKGQGSKFKLPKFGISIPEIEGPKIDVRSDKPEIDISVPKASIDVQPPEIEVQGVTAEIKGVLPEVDSKDIEMKMKTPGFSFPRIGLGTSDIKSPEVDVNLPNVDVSLPEGSIEIEQPSTDVTMSVEDAEHKGRLKFGSPTKFKLPSFTLPKFGTKGSKATIEVSDVDIDVKGPEISLPEAEMKLSAEPITVDIKGPDVSKEMKSLSMEIQDQDLQLKGQGSKFKLPKFGISLPEVKGPKVDVSSDKAEIDISVPKTSIDVQPPEVEVQGVTAEIKGDLPELDSKDIEMKMKTPGFSFPRIGLGKSDIKSPEVDVNLPSVGVSLPEGSIEIEKPSTDVTMSVEDAEHKGRLKFGSPTKFKLPSFTLPKFGTKGPKATVEVSDVEIDVKGPEISLPEAEMKLSAEPITVDIKGPDVSKEIKSLSMEIQDQDLQLKGQGSKFKLPKFGISLPEVKGPKIDVSSDKAKIDIPVPKAKVEVQPPEIEVQGVTAEIKGDLPEVDSKDIEMKMKTPGFSFPRIGLGKSDIKSPEVDVNLPNVDVCLPEGSIEMEQPSTDVTMSVEDAEHKGRLKFGSPTKFKLPSFTLPKFGTKGSKATVEVSDVDVDVKGPKISLPEAEVKLSAEPITVDIKGPDVSKEMKSLSMEIQDQDLQLKGQGSKFKLPKFGISLPEVKGPKIDVSSDKAEIDIPVSKAKVEVHPPEVEMQGVTAEIKSDMPEVDSKDIEIKMKTPGFSFPRIGLGKSDIKSPEVDVNLPNVDVSLPEGSIEMEQPSTDVTMSVEETEHKGRLKFGSPTKFKLPSFTLPKFGTKGPKATVEVSDVDVDVKGPEISLPEAEIKLSSEPITVDIKGPDASKEMKSLNMEVRDQNIEIKKQGSQFKLPKFGISLPEVKGPKIDVMSDKAEIDISVPKASIDVHPPEIEVQGVTAEIKGDLPEVDSKDIEMKMITPGFSFPRIVFSKSDVKSPEVDMNLPNVDVSLPETRMEMEQPSTDVTMSVDDAEHKGGLTFGSPTKFKLPSFTLPKFGTKGSKATIEVSDVDIDLKGPEISLPEAEMKLSAEPITVDIKGPDVSKETKSLSMEIQDQDLQLKGQGSKFKLPKFGISLPEVKGPKVDVSSDKAEIDMSVPKASIDVQPPEVEVQGVTAEIKGDLPELDSKDIEMKMKTPGFSFPRIGLGKSDIKSPEVDVNLPNVDVSLPEGSIEIEKPSTDVTMSVEDTEHKGRLKFGSPTKFKLPSFTLPKFGTKGSKATVEVSDVDVDVKGPKISLPEAEMKLSAEPITVDIKGPDASKEMKSLSMEIQDQDLQLKGQGSKFKLPKFGISLPEVKGPKIDVSSDKAKIDIPVPKAKVEVQPPEIEVQGVTAEIKGDLPEVDSKDIEMKMKTPGFSFPRIGLGKSDIKSPEVDVNLPNVDVSLPEGSIEMEQPSTDVTMSVEDTEHKGRLRFGSPTKFKLPSFTLPKFGTKGSKATVEVSDVDVVVKGPKISLPEAEIKLSAEPITVDIKGPDVSKEMKSLSMEIQDQDLQLKGQGSKFKLPKFGISLPEVKGPKIEMSSDKAEIDISVPKASIDVQSPEIEVQGVTAKIKGDLPEVDSKDMEIKMKTPGFSFPRIGLGKSDIKSTEVDVNLPNVDVSLPEGSIEIEQPSTDVTMSVEDTEHKGRLKFGSPTKFKLPSFTLPKFGTKGSKATVEVSDVDVDVKGPKISLPEAEMKLSAEPIKADVKGPDPSKEMKSLSMEIQDQDLQLKGQGSKFKLPKFGISLPEVKGPKIDVSSDKPEIDISVPKASIGVHPPEVELQGLTGEIKGDLPEVVHKDIEMKITTPGFSFPRFGFSKSDVKSPEVDVSLPNVDVSLLEGSIEVEKPSTDVTMSVEDAEKQDWSKSGSPTRFKLPSIDFPKFGTKGAKVALEVPDVDVDVTGPEISLPDAEMELSVKTDTVDIKSPDLDKEIKLTSMEMKDHHIQIEEQESKFKLPKFGIIVPELKGPKIDISFDKKEMDILGAKEDVCPPEVEVHGLTAKIKTDLPADGSKDIEVEMKTAGFSFPRIGFSKSSIKSPELDVSTPSVDVSLPEASMEMEQPTTDVTTSVEDAEHKGRSKFGSPTKFKLPSINFPKFGTKGPKATVEGSEVNVKGPEIGLPYAEMKLSAEPVTVDTMPSTEMKDQDINIKEKGSKFKLPKFDISLPEVKGPTFDVSLDKREMDISVPRTKEAAKEVHPPDVEVQGLTAKIKTDLPELDSKDTEAKMKTPGFSFPRIGLSKADIKSSEVDVNLPNVDVSLPEGCIEIERPTTDVTMSVEDAEHKGRSKFGSPTRFKLPSINFPKFGTKVPKATVEVSDVNVKGPEISLPEADIKLSAEQVTMDMKEPGTDKEMKSLSMKIKDQDLQIKEQGIAFKLPKFEISVPEMKGPKLDVRTDKAEIDISTPKAKAEVHTPDVKVQGVTAEIKGDLPEVDSKDISVKMKTPGFSFSRTGFSKSDAKATMVDPSLQNVDMPLPEGSMEIKGPTTDVTISVEDAEQKGRSKFGSPTKFKLPSINFPKFGSKGPKATVEVSDVDVDVKGPEISLPDTELNLPAEPLSVVIKGSDADKGIKLLSMEVKDQDIQVKEQESTFKFPKFGISLPEIKGPKIDISSEKAEIEAEISVPKAKADVHPLDVEVQEVATEVKVDLPEALFKETEMKIKRPGLSFPSSSQSDSKSPAGDKVAIPELDSQVGKCGDDDTFVNDKAVDVEQKYTQGVKTSSKFILPSLGDVFSGFEVEFNVPTFEEIEEAKKMSELLKQEHKIVFRDQVSTVQNTDGMQIQPQPEESDWFRFPKSSSPTKNAKEDENVASKFPRKFEQSPQSNINENEYKKNIARETDEETVSPTLSLSSSDAFADVSSAFSTEPFGLSMTSPTKVKVKYSEPTSETEISDIHGDIITSTARTKLISMEPYQPEKVNIPFSSETSSSSLDTLKQISGHIVVSNVQSVSTTEHATIFTKLDRQNTQTLPPGTVTDTLLSAEQTVMRKGHTVVEKRVVKEIFSDDKDKIFVTQRIQVFEGDSSEPISDDTASSIQRLRDTVHTEKIRFFEGAEPSKTIIMSTETLLRHADSSTDENEGQ